MIIETTERPLCPDPELLGTFAEGSATPEETRMLRDHLATCNDCLEEVGEIASFAEEERKIVPMRKRPPLSSWLWGVAAALALVAVGLNQWKARRTDSTDALRQAMPADSRIIEPRLSGFAFRPYDTNRGPGEERDPDAAFKKLTFETELDDLIADKSKEHSTDARHTVAIAKLMRWNAAVPEGQGVRNVEEAIAELKALANENPRNARLWNDYAAAVLVGRKPNEAFTAATRALELDPSLREAAYNRALALRDLGREAEAKAAWRAYVATEKDASWREDANGQFLNANLP